MATTEERDALRIARVRDIIGRHFAGGVTGRTVLDLAARTGAFSVALAADGAAVTAIEGREENIHQWPPREPGHAVRVVQGDVRDLAAPFGFDLTGSQGTVRQFDVVLCLGILYHLEADDGRKLLRDVWARTAPGGIAIIDTHVGGHSQAEPGGIADPWGSIGNAQSWWFDRDELVVLLSDGGFVQVDHLTTKAYPDEPDSRAWFVAMKDVRS